MSINLSDSTLEIINTSKKKDTIRAITVQNIVELVCILAAIKPSQ
jgi:hypothetical protein